MAYSMALCMESKIMTSSLNVKMKGAVESVVRVGGKSPSEYASMHS